MQAKDHDRPAGINVVGEFSAVIKDVGANKGILICKSGFTEGARKLAQNLGIDTCNIHDAQSRDWKLEVRKQDFKPTGDIFYFRTHGRNAKAWWSHKESWERHDYLYTRAEIKKIAATVKQGASAPGVKKSFAVFNNHARANSAANAIMPSQELGLRLKAMPSEAMVANFPDLVQGRERLLKERG